jgi:segregation and condensation protein A
MRPAEAEQTTDSPPTSEIPAGAQVSVSLPTFEGPLDLLLHLCQKHELNILDIPIGFVTEKYLEYLAVMQIMSLDIASEYLVMAATLAHIKSKMLLPAPPPGQDDELTEDEEDQRESLIRRLLEYQKHKLAGEQLHSRGVAGRDIFMRGMPVDEAVQTGLPPLAQVALFSLVEAFQSVLSRSKIKISHDVVHERITLTDRINELVDILRVRKRIQFEEMFDGLGTRFDLVITFLAVLEMTKLRMTRLHQSEPTAPIYVEFSAQIEETSEPSKPEEPIAEEPKLETNVSDTEPPPEMGAATDPPPPGTPHEADAEAEVEQMPAHDPLETIPSPPLSEDEDPK